MGYVGVFVCVCFLACGRRQGMQTSKQVGKQAGRQAYRRASRQAVKMHGKLCFSIAVHENHVKMEAAGPFAIGMILPVRKNAWKIVFFNCGT